MGKIEIWIEVDSEPDSVHRLLRVLLCSKSVEERRKRLQLLGALSLFVALFLSRHSSKEVCIRKMRHRTVWVQFQSALKFFLRFRPVPIVRVNDRSESAVPFRQFVVEFHCFPRGISCLR